MSYSFMNYVRDYQNSVSRMNDNRLRLEWVIVSTVHNKYSGKPVLFKMDILSKEASRRGLK